MESNNQVWKTNVTRTLVSPENTAARLERALKMEDPSAFMIELAEAIRLRGGYAAAATSTGFNRTALYKIVSPNGNPVLSTLVSLLAHVGLRLSIDPVGNADPAAEPSSMPFKADGPQICLLPYKALEMDQAHRKVRGTSAIGEVRETTVISRTES